jgi:tRNA(Ile)-lysidine synthase
MLLVDTLRQTIESQKLFDYSHKILVAVSGGPDSTALLHALKQLGYNICAAHLNHGFRGDEAQADADYVAQWCDKLSIPLESAYRDVPSAKKL